MPRRKGHDQKHGHGTQPLVKHFDAGEEYQKRTHGKQGVTSRVDARAAKELDTSPRSAKDQRRSGSR
jgi:hypothetical protein